MIAKLALVLSITAPAQSPTDSTRAGHEIRMVALRHVADVRRCYEREGLTRDPGLSGTLDVTVTVQATGVVTEAAISAHDMRGIGAREVAACLTTVIRNWRFERGPYVVETLVFPFSFRPDAGGNLRVVTS
jgi:hypothetical protein